MRKTVALFAFISTSLLPVMVVCQNFLPQVKPLTPNTAALFQVLERPIGTFTGTVPVQFSLCAINSGGLSTSLGLSYDRTGGLRVEEASSSVGLGFSLNDGGGRITQLINGTGDDWTNGRLSNSIKPSNFNCSDMNGDVSAAFYRSYELDLEPDIFMYNINGQSGKFFFTEQGKIIMMQKTGIKVEYFINSGSDHINKWMLTDDRGNKYYLGTRQVLQYTSTDQSTSHSSSGTSSINWYLDSAKDITEKNALYFSHQASLESFTTYSGGRMVLPPLALCTYFDLATHDNIVTTDGTELLVSTITGRSGSVVISGSTGRLDGLGRKIDSIRLFTPDNQLVKKYKFNYDYFSVGSNAWEKRLYLKDFSEFGSTGNDSITHKFEYYTDQILPSRLSSQVDTWGFYNGKANTTMFPNYVFKTGAFEYRNTSLADKSPSFNHTRACALKKITYPTGGTREFVYEGNTALVPFNPNLFHPDATNSVTQSFFHTETEFNANYGALPFFTAYFEVNSTDGSSNFTYDMGSSLPCGVEVKLYKTTTANQSSGGTLIYDYTFKTNEDHLFNGYYRIEFYRASAGCYIPSVTGSWSECILSLGIVHSPHYPSEGFNENIKTVGGLRIKEINDYEPVTGKTQTTKYRYKLYSTDSTLSSGLLISEPQFIAGQQPPGVGCSVNAVLASSNNPLSSEGGSFVVYPEVRTIEDGNGWIDQTYSFAPDVMTATYVPYTPALNNSFYRGKLLEYKIYNNSGRLLKKTTTSYEYQLRQIAQGLRVRAYWSPQAGCGEWSEYSCAEPLLAPTDAFCNSFELQFSANDIAEQNDTTFLPGGALVQKTSYIYDTLMNGRMFLSKLKTYLNNGERKETTYRYAFNSDAKFLFGLTGGEQTVKTALLSNNYLQPLETVDSLFPVVGSGIFISGTKYIFSNSGSAYFLSKARMYTTLSDSTEFNFSGYDPKWNLTEKYQTNGVKEVYLWGYNYSYPVAKVVGSDYTTVAALVNNSVLQNPASDAALQSELNLIRTSLAGSTAQVTTYAYKKGVGISSQTDPSGKTTYYEYDSFGRLTLIKDHEGNIVKRICYNYQGQVTDCSSPNIHIKWSYENMHGVISDGYYMLYADVYCRFYDANDQPLSLSNNLNVPCIIKRWFQDENGNIISSDSDTTEFAFFSGTTYELIAPDALVRAHYIDGSNNALGVYYDSVIEFIPDKRYIIKP